MFKPDSLRISASLLLKALLVLLPLVAVVSQLSGQSVGGATLSEDHEYIVHGPQGADILPTWHHGERRLFDLEDLLRITRPLTLREGDWLRVLANGHQLELQAGARFLQLDGRTLVLDGPCPLPGQALLDLRLLDTLLVHNLLVGRVDHTSESLDVSGLQTSLRRETLRGGEVLRMQFGEIPVFESEPGDTKLVLMLPDGSGVSAWNSRDLDAICEGGLLKRIRVLQEDAGDRIEFIWERGGEFFELVELESLGEVQLVLRQPGSTSYSDELVEQDAPRIQAPLKAIELDLIVLDPGHGGKDPGAISARGRYEKDFTLALARELRRELRRRLPNVDVLLTRDEDSFLSLSERTALANRQGGKLFISLHANAAKDRRARGWEVYFLKTGRNQHAREVALKENAVLALEENSATPSPENWILATMAQSAYARESETLAALMAEDLHGVGHTRKRRVLQAGFHVLVGASMPAVLVEAGFISNRTDEDLLFSAQGQAQLARELAESIVRFRDMHAGH